MIKYSSLNPYEKEINEKDFKDIISELKECKDVCQLENYSDKPYFFSEEYLTKQNRRLKKKAIPTIMDMANYYILISYLINESEFSKPSTYEKFLEDDVDNIKKFLFNSTLENYKSDYLKNINIDLVKGSIYKIKQYFLENSKIKDIRGASTLLDYANTDLVYEYLDENFIRECSIYCGGGNVLLLVPKGKGKDVCKDLEEKFNKYTLTAKVAFEYVETNLNEFFYNYKNVAKDINIKLNYRKKIKLFPISPKLNADFIKNGLNIKGTKIDMKLPRAKKKCVCDLCGIRDAEFLIKSEFDEFNVCSSCSMKNKVGSKIKSRFYSEYKSRFKYIDESIELKGLDDIKDELGNIAVIYADGNNMGNVVMSVSTPFEQAYFSRKLEEVTKKSVYESFNDAMGHKARFEVIALGGDDIFIIVPGNEGLNICRMIIEKFDSAFKDEMTMSVGMCVGKSNMNIKYMFNESTKALKRAKRLVKNNELNEGSLDVLFMNGGYCTIDNKKYGLFPQKRDDLLDTINEIKNIKKQGFIKKSQLYKLAYASREMDNNEFKLFYLYQNSRLISNNSSCDINKYMKKLYKLNKNLIFDGLIKEIDKTGNCKNIYSPWEDILMLWDLVGGEEYV